MATSTTRGVLIAMIDEAFEGKAWHGPTLRGSLRGLTARQATWRPGRHRHNIWEIAVHAAYWKYAVRRRLTGERRRTFALTGSNWFDVSGRSWPDDVRMLIGEHRALRAAIVALPPSALDRRVHGRHHSAAYTIRGIAAHDLYHAGQIQLIKKLQDGRIAGLQKGR
jgi:hypothetical protein